MKGRFVQVFRPVDAEVVAEDMVRFVSGPNFNRITHPKKHMLQRDFPLLSIWYGHYSDDRTPQLTIAAPYFNPPTHERFGTLGTLIGTYPWPEAWRVLFAHAEFFK